MLGFVRPHSAPAPLPPTVRSSWLITGDKSSVPCVITAAAQPTVPAHGVSFTLFVPPPAGFSVMPSMCAPPLTISVKIPRPAPAPHALSQCCVKRRRAPRPATACCPWGPACGSSGSPLPDSGPPQRFRQPLQKNKRPNQPPASASLVVCPPATAIGSAGFRHGAL